MKGAKKKTSHLAHKTETRAVTTRLSVSIDQRTATILKQLQRSREADPTETVREILSSVSKGDIKRRDLIAFHRDVWDKLIGRPERNILARYSVPRELHEELYILSKEILGTKNASEMFRLCVTFFGIRAGLVRVEQTMAARLSLISPE